MVIGVKVENGVVVNRVVGVPDGYIETDGAPQIGWAYTNGVFSAPPAPNPTWDEIRQERDALLAVSDWTQIADAPLSAEDQQQWADYRQDLRDLPQDFENPGDVVFPEKP